MYAQHKSEYTKCISEFLERKQVEISTQIENQSVTKNLLVLLEIFSHQRCELGCKTAVMQTLWKKFLINPSHENYQIITTLLNKAQAQPSFRLFQAINSPRKNDILESENILRFLQLIKVGNPFAVQLGFDLVQFTDGFYAEMLISDLGNSVKKVPTVFLISLKKHGYFLEDGTEEILFDVGSFKADGANIAYEAITEIDERIVALITVADPNLMELRNKAINFLLENKKKYLHNDKNERN